MNRPWIWNLVLLVALAVVIARFPSALSAPRLMLPPIPSPPVREPLVLHSPSPPPAAEALQGIVSRNLFHVSRGKVKLVTEAVTPAPPPVAAAPLNATLFGVVIEEAGERYAYLLEEARGGSSRPKKYREGDSFAGAKVKSIRADRVILEAGSREQTVNLRSPKEGIPFVAPASPPVNSARPAVLPMPGSAGRAPGTPAPRPAKRLRRPQDTTGSRGPGPVPTRQRSRPAFLDAGADRNADGSVGRRWPGQIDGEEDYSQDEYPGAGNDADYYYEDKEYESEAPW